MTWREYRLHQARCLFESGRPAGRPPRLLGTLRAASLGDARLHSELGSLLLLLGRHAESLAQYTRAVELEPAVAEYRFNQAALHRYLGQVEAAEAGFDAALALKPDEYEAYNARSQVRTQTPGTQPRGAVAAGHRAHAPIRQGWCSCTTRSPRNTRTSATTRRSFGSLEAGADTKRRHMRYQRRDRPRDHRKPSPRRL